MAWERALFTPLTFLDYILSAEFLLKFSITVLEVKIDINRVNFDIIEVKLILITGWLGRTFGVPWFWWKKKISRSCFIWKCFLYQNGCFFESLLLWWVDSEPNKLMRQINVWDKISWLVQYDFKNSKRSRFDLMQNFPI